MCRAANNRSTTPTEPPRIRSTLPNQPTESPRRQTSQPIFHESAPRRRTQPTESPRRQISQPIRQESSSRHQISQPSLHEQCQQSDPIQQRASAVLCGFGEICIGFVSELKQKKKIDFAPG
uniref:Uncharacterized protein n=1 Tax=Caenorhabditis japonica TaxID=281687 RepID=A0A8R1EDM6_CAEJA